MLQKDVFGQHIVAEILPNEVFRHIRDAEPAKALTISFHGSTGTGKNFVADKLVQAVFHKGLDSQFFHKYIGYHHASKGKVMYLVSQTVSC